MDLEHFGLAQWYLLAFAVYFFNVIVRNTASEGGKACRYAAIITAIVLAYIASLRSGIGDTGTYLGIMKTISRNPLTVFANRTADADWGFYVIMSCIKLVFGYNPQAFLFIIGLLIYIPTFFWLEKITGEFDFCVLIYILGGSFIVSMNGLRQALVAAWFFSCIDIVRNKQYIKAILICLVLATIHQSAIILLPVIFVMNAEVWDKKSFILLAVFILLYIAYPFFGNVLTYFIQETRYFVYSEQITVTGHSANIIRAGVAAVPLILSFILRDELSKEERFAPCLQCSLFNFGFVLLATARSWILARFCIYFSPHTQVVTTKALQSAYNRNVLYVSSILLYAVYFAFDNGFI